MRWSRSLVTLVGTTVVVLAAYRMGRARADGVPTVSPLYYTGTIEDGGRPIEGTRNVTILLWDAVTSGSVRCSTSAPGTAFAGGQFRVALDGSCVAAIRATPDLWAEVLLEGTTFPRMKLGAVPYAIEAARASAAAGALETRIAALEAAARPRQSQLGAPASYNVDLMSGSTPVLSPIPGGPTLTLTARSSSPYRVCTDVVTALFTGGSMRIGVAGTGHRMLWQPESRMDGSNGTFTAHLCLYVQLAAGMSYVFSLEAAGGYAPSSGWRLQSPAGGGVLVAEQLD